MLIVHPSEGEVPYIEVAECPPFGNQVVYSFISSGSNVMFTVLMVYYHFLTVNYLNH